MYYYVLDVYLFSNEERKNWCEFLWLIRWGISRKSWERDTIIILYEKNLFSTKRKLKQLLKTIEKTHKGNHVLLYHIPLYPLCLGWHPTQEVKQ